jgi:nitrogen fixation/metabolism regulation signal transduction histidine kinase
MDQELLENNRGLLQSSKPEGSGLGLMVVKRIVESHGGALRLKSSSNQGTSIAILFPVSRQMTA